MLQFRAVTFSRILWFATLLAGLWPARAAAVPVFANGQGVSCETCHTTFPGMTRYGMMVMMTNFQILNRHLQDQALPLAVRLYITSYLANHSRSASTSVSDLSLLSGGFMGKNFTYYAEQHIIDSSQIGDTEQLWLSWNGLLHGTNSIQAGKFHTPFPFMPAHAWTLADYLLATQTTGQNEWNPNDARWGFAFNGMSNEFMYNAAYLTGDGPVGDAFDYNAQTQPRTLDFNVSYGGMSQPWSVGLVGIWGQAPLHDSTTNLFSGQDPFSRQGLYFGYQTDAWHLQTMYYHGFDAHPDTDAFNIPLNGYFLEVGRDFGWRNHVVVRYDVASSDTLNRQYLLDYSHNIQPNLALIGELLVGPQQVPQIGFQVAYAGPYDPGKRFVWNPSGGADSIAKGISVVPANANAAAAAAPASPAPPANGVAQNASADANEGARLVQANGCTGCHGAQWQGAIGPKLYGIEHSMSPLEIAMRLKSPTPPMPNFGFTDAQIADIVAYLSTLDGGGGAQAGPVITFEPANPVKQATIRVVFGGTPPHRVTAQPIMQMGAGKMHTVEVTLQPLPSDPHSFSGTLTFSMGGPWIVIVNYDGATTSVPINVGV